MLTTTASAVRNMSTTVNPNGSLTETPKDPNTFEQCDYAFLFSHLPMSLQSAHSDITAMNTSLEESTYKLGFAVMCVLFGWFFSICGYRFLKMSTFLVGFSLGSSIIYLIMSEQKQLSLVENLIISVSIGVLFAFVALLVQYIGLFLIGITSSISIVTCILILIDLFYTNKSAWVCIGLLFLCATILASLSLKFQKSLTIVNTSIIGSALLFIAIDFFVENYLLIDYILELFKVNGHTFKIYERQKALLQQLPANKQTVLTTKSGPHMLTKSSTSTFMTPTVHEHLGGNATTGALALFLRLYSSAHAKLCWYTWLVFGSFFVLLLLSLIVQFLGTGRNYDHRDSWQKLIRGSRKKKSANLEKIRLKSNLNESDSHHHHLTHHHSRSFELNNSSTSCSSSHIDLVATNQNDTLLLVEPSQNNSSSLSYTVSSTRNESSKILHQSKSNHGNKNSASNARSGVESDFEIVSFEIIKPAKAGRAKPKAKNKFTSNPNAGKKSLEEKPNQTASVSTTTSTSSSSSSTCQLIPMKLNSNLNNNNTTASLITTTTSIGNGLICPSSPKILSPVPSSQQSGGLIPPPVPTLPPPKLPVSLVASKTDTLNSALSLNSTIHLPTLPGPKMKHHRQTATPSKEITTTKTSEKFRQLYQIRRNNGDVLSQDFLKNIQTKQSSSTQLSNNTNTNSSNTTGSIEVNNFFKNMEPRSSSLSSGEKKKSNTKNQNP